MACKQYYVYKHTTPNGKVYIGITKQNPSNRWLNGLGYKHSTYFFNAIVKYGWLNIEHEILQSNLTLEEANRLEQKYINEYNSSDRQYGYNIQFGGINRSVTDTTNYCNIKTGNNKGKQVIVYNKLGQYVGEFISSYQAAKILGCDQSHIRECCQNKNGRKQHKGYIFKYKENLI